MKKWMFVVFMMGCALILPSRGICGLGIDIGPFSFTLDGGFQVGTPHYHFYNDPICEAIRDHDLIAMYVRDGEKIDRIVIEPYAFGYDKNGHLVLQGYQVEQIELKESDEEQEGGQGFIGGVFSFFKGNTWTDIPIRKVERIQVLEDSDFAFREDAFKKLKEKDELVEVICSVAY